MWGIRRTVPVRVLLIEDDREAADYLVKGLGESGYVVDHADDGTQGLILATRRSYDVMIVDRMLPGLEGLSIIETLRKNDVKTPALVLSAKASVPRRNSQTANASLLARVRCADGP